MEMVAITSPRKQRILSLVLGVPAAVLLIAFLAYQFAADSPLAVPTLLLLLGFVLGGGTAYTAARKVRPRETLTGKLLLGGALAATSILCIVGSEFLPDKLGGEYTASGTLIDGVLYSFGLMTFFRLMFPEQPAREAHSS